MTNRDKAAIILETLDETININRAFEDIYIKSIIKALTIIDHLEKTKG